MLGVELPGVGGVVVLEEALERGVGGLGRVPRPEVAALDPGAPRLARGRALLREPGHDGPRGQPQVVALERRVRLVRAVAA